MNAAGQDLHGLAINSSSFESLKEIPVGRKWGDDGDGAGNRNQSLSHLLVPYWRRRCRSRVPHGRLGHRRIPAREAVAQRFPESRNQLNNSRPGTLMAGLMQAKQQQIALFTPDPSVPADAARLSDGPVQVALGKTFGPDWPQLQAKLTVTAARHARPNALLDDSQIASIKQRLNLTPSQERMWPAVEAELRKLAYAPEPQP